MKEKLMAMYEAQMIDASGLLKAVEQGSFAKLLFRHVAGQAGTAGVGDDDVKKTPVVSHVKYGLIFRNILFSDYGDLHTGDQQHQPEYTLDDAKGTDIFGVRIEFSDDPLHQHQRNGQNQVSDDYGHDNNGSDHKHTS